EEVLAIIFLFGGGAATLIAYSPIGKAFAARIRGETPQSLAALQGLGMNTVNANLMPVAIIRKSVWKSKSAWFGIAAGLAVATGAAMFIRPVIDDFAVVGSNPDTVIETAIREARDLKSKAEEAGVIGDAAVDNRPVNMMSLLDNRAIHAYLVDDLSKMLEDAQSKAATGEDQQPAFVVKAFQTSYRHGSSSIDSEFGSGQQAATSRGGHGGYETPADETGTEVAAKRTVECVLDVTTTQPDARKFMLATIDRWLKENKVREGVPYTIVVDQTPWTMRDETKTAAAGNNSSGRSGPFEDRTGHGGGGHGDRPMRAIDRIRQDDPNAVIIGASPEQGGPGAYAGSLPSFNSLKPKEPAGTTRATFRVQWHVEINEPKAPDESGETADGGGA
ncbi:MAG: hypothetical protein L6Q35_11595, partial [Phycisphaerales bacterium]|nr:hypothetical protein [Phycisphaerales bacterium]